MNQQRMRPYEHPSAWKGADLRESDKWILQLSLADNDELQAALAIAQARAHLAGLLRDKIVQEFE